MGDGARDPFGRLKSLVPGYTGYTVLKKRRDTEQALRVSLVARLGEARAALGRKIEAPGTRFERAEALQGVKRRVVALADSVRHPPAGSAKLFTAASIDDAILAGIHAAELGAVEACDAAAAAAEAIPVGAPEPAVDRAHAALAVAEAAFRRRAEVLSAVG